MNHRRIRQEIRLLSTEINTSMKNAKAFKAQGKMEQADAQMHKVLRLHARIRGLKIETLANPT